MSLAAARFSPRPEPETLQLRPGMTFRDWAAVGRRLSRVSSASTWALGDWLLFGERTFGQRYRTAVAATNLDYQTLRNYAWVAGRFDSSRRRGELSFQHHAELASLTEVEQDLWLQRAAHGNWSRNELRRQMKRHRNGATAAAASLVVRVELTQEDEQRWRQAANSTQLGLMDWLRTVANAAADAALQAETGAPATAY